MNEIILTHSHNQVTASSLEIAEHFEKEHKNVLRDIGSILSQSTDAIQFYFEADYFDSYGRPQRSIQMTRDGFSLLVMGFTGSKAMEWKLKYIAAFNELERTATKPMSQLELIVASAQALVEQEKRLNAVEKKQDAIIDTFASSASMDWPSDMNARINRICKNSGINYRDFRRELYIQLEATARVDLTARQNNFKKRAIAAGHKKTDVDAISKINVIADDPKLRAIFEHILKTEQVKRIGKDSEAS